jgi:WD40 repeat protein
MTPAAVLLVCAVGIADWGPVRVDAEGVPLPPGVVARIGSTRFRHGGSLHQLLFTPDGRYLVGANATNIYVWDANTGLRVATHAGFRDIEHVAIRPDGRLAFIAHHAREQHFILLDRASGRILQLRKIEDGHGDNILSNDGAFLARRYGGLVKVHDTANWKLVGDLRFSISDYSPEHFRFSPDGKMIVGVFGGNWTEVREVATGNMPYAGLASGENSAVQIATFSRDNKRLVRLITKHGLPLRFEGIDLKSEEIRTLMDWNEPQRKDGAMVVQDGLFTAPEPDILFLAEHDQMKRIDLKTKNVRKIELRLHGMTDRCALSPDGGRLALALSNGTIQLLDATTLAKLPQSSDELDSKSIRGHFQFGGRVLALEGFGYCQSFDVLSRKLLKQILHPAGAATSSLSAILHPDGNLYVLSEAGSIVVRDLSSDTVRMRYDWEGNGSPPRIAFTGGGRWLMADGDYEFRYWDLHSSYAVTTVSKNNQSWYPSPDGRWAFALRDMLNTEVASYELDVVDVRHGASRSGWEGNRQCKGLPLFHPNSRFAWIATAARECSLIDVDESRILWTRAMSRRSPENGVFSPDGRSIAVRQRRAIQFLEASTGKLRYAMPSLESQRPLAFTPDGKLLAAIGPTAPLYLWDVRGELRNFPNRLDAATTEALWKDLLADDAEAAYRALQRLAAAPDTTLPFVRATVRPAVAPAKAKVAAWIAALDAPAFRDREAATKELKMVAETIAGELRAARDATTSLEVHERLGKILAMTYPESPESVRRTRIVELVEWCGTSDAKALLKSWSAGAPGSLLATEAKVTLARLR